MISNKKIPLVCYVHKGARFYSYFSIFQDLMKYRSETVKYYSTIWYNIDLSPTTSVWGSLKQKPQQIKSDILKQLVIT